MPRQKTMLTKKAIQKRWEWAKTLLERDEAWRTLEMIRKCWTLDSFVTIRYQRRKGSDLHIESFMCRHIIYQVDKYYYM